MSEPYFCTKCNRNHKSGKIYKEHEEFRLKIYQSSGSPKADYIVYDEIHEIDPEVLEETTSVVIDTEKKTVDIKQAGIKRGYTIDLQSNDLSPLNVEEPLISITTIEKTGNEFHGAVIGEKVEVVETKEELVLSKKDKKQTKKGKVFPPFYLFEKDLKAIWMDWIIYVTKDKSKEDILEHCKKHINEKNVNRYSSDNLFAMLLYKEGIPIENMKVNYKKCSDRFLRKFRKGE